MQVPTKTKMFQKWGNIDTEALKGETESSKLVQKFQENLAIFFSKLFEFDFEFY